MGRQDNVEIFEDTQRLYRSNERLISAIKNSSAAQECFTGTGRYWYGPEHRIYQKPAQVVVSSKRTLEVAAPWWWRDQGLVCTGRSNLPLFYALSEPERTEDVESVLCTPSARPRPAA